MDTLNAQTFLALLLVYVSDVDGSLNADELEYMRKEVGENALEEARRLCRHRSDYELIALLQESKERYYPGPNGTAVLMRELNGYFVSDGVFSDWERAIAHNLQRVLD